MPRTIKILLLSLSLSLSLFLPPSLFCALKEMEINAHSAILVNPANGAILYEKNSQQPLSPASLTKIATALYGLTLLGDQLERPVTVIQDDIGAQAEEEMKRLNYKNIPPHRLIFGASHIGLKKDEILPLSALFYGLMVVSGNDAANAIARTAGGSYGAFMQDLNLYLKKIGCHQTHFYNPHGQYYPGHTTTAYDMAVMTIEALKNPFFREIAAASRFERPKTNKQEAALFMQKNRLVRPGSDSYYPYAIGVKTGYHSEAKHCLSAAATKDGRTLVLIQMGSPEKGAVFKDAIRLFKEAFNEQEGRYVLFPQGVQSFKMEHPVLSAPLKVSINEEIALNYFPAEKPKLTAKVHWEANLLSKQGQEVGRIEIIDERGKVQKKVALYAEETPQYQWGYYLRHPSLWGWGIYLCFLLPFLGMILWLGFKRT